MGAPSARRRWQNLVPGCCIIPLANFHTQGIGAHYGSLSRRPLASGSYSSRICISAPDAAPRSGLAAGSLLGTDMPCATSVAAGQDLERRERVCGWTKGVQEG